MNITTLKTISQNFTRELIDAQKGNKTSLPFIVHQLANHPIVKDGETFQVLKIGGSILQKSLVELRDGNVVTKTFSEEHLPIFTTKDIFLSVIDKHLDPRSQVVAINFAFPMNPIFENGKLDGILARGTKEHAFVGLLNQKIGKTIELYIKSKYDRTIRVSAANDTICLALAGLTKYPAERLSGGIVGTGMNFAVFLDKTHLVNLEAANFNKFPQSEEGKQIDAQSIEKGLSLYEKEVSGGYLYHHLNILFSKNHIKHPAVESTHALDTLARGNIEKVSKLAQDLLEHSASLIACQIAGIANFKKRDMVFVMEGSLFWIGRRYQTMVEQYVGQLTEHKVLFVEIKDCGILGAAKLVT